MNTLKHCHLWGVWFFWTSSIIAFLLSHITMLIISLSGMGFLILLLFSPFSSAIRTVVEMFNVNKKDEVKTIDKKLTNAYAEQSAQSTMPLLSVNEENNVRETTISSGTVLRGEIKNVNNITINGTVTGDVFSQKLTQIGKDGKVIGSIKSDRVVINGQLKGSCYAQIVFIMSRGRVEGDIHAVEFSIEKGGIFIGNSHHAEDSGTTNGKKGKKQTEVTVESSLASIALQSAAMKNDNAEIKKQS